LDGAGVAAWRAVTDSEPDFAQRAQTLRADGSPRISGIEASFVRGQLWFGSMPDARKGQDLRRDPPPGDRAVASRINRCIAFSATERRLTTQ
jgi:hypothetical protein